MVQPNSDKPTSDKAQIGLTPDGDEALREIASEYFGGGQQDAYRFSIAYAVAVGLTPEDAPDSGYQTKFNALGGVESGTSVRDLLDVLGVGDPARPFATAERLADIGARNLASRLRGSEGLADILESLNDEDRG